jgi:zinc protease
MNTYATFVDEVNKVTAADLQRLAAQYIQPDKMAVVIVGDRSKIEEDVRKLNLGPITFLTIDELFR